MQTKKSFKGRIREREREGGGVGGEGVREELTKRLRNRQTEDKTD